VIQRRLRWVSDRVKNEPAGRGERRPQLLVLCDYRPYEAATVIDHIEAIRTWSRSDVFVLPTFGDLPDELDLDAFDGVVIHYNLVMANPAYLTPLARWRIHQYRGVKAAFVQDEYRFVNSTVSVIRTLGINVLFTCVPEDQVELVYPHASLPDLQRKVTVMTGYVPELLLSLPPLPYDERTTDVVYRARRLPAWMGALAQEKAMIADRFQAEGPARGLKVDISTREADRLYGNGWVDFIRRSKAMLGVESGAGVFDFDGSIEHAVRAHLRTHPDAPFDELHRLFLSDVDGRIRLNQISPRCFEAAALGTLMVLYPGEYSGILQPWRHYVPLLKDHSNISEVVDAIRDQRTWERITQQARDEVALNPRYSFRAMVETVDHGLDLRITSQGATDPARFERIAVRSFARLRTTQLRAFGLPPVINRIRLSAVRTIRALKPSPIAMPPGPPGRSGGRLRNGIRFLRSLIYWALRPAVLPWGSLLADRSALLRELSVLGRLQVMGGRAVRAGGESPFVVVLDETTCEVRLGLRGNAPIAGRPLRAIPDDLSWASGARLDLDDQWLAPVGLTAALTQPLDALSRLVRVRPDVVRGLLAGPGAWCDLLEIRPNEKA
jgi:hypothetical protein